MVAESGEFEGGATDGAADVEGAAARGGVDHFGDGADGEVEGGDGALLPREDFVSGAVVEEQVFVNEAGGFVEIGHGNDWLEMDWGDRGREGSGREAERPPQRKAEGGVRKIERGRTALPTPFPGESGIWLPQSIGSQSVQQVGGGLEVFDEDFGLAAADHADLTDVEVRSFVGGEEDVVVRGVAVFLEEIRGDVAAEMVVAAGGEVTGAEDLFVLDVGSGDGEDLSAEAEFAEDTGHGVGDETIVVGVDGELVAGDEVGADDAAAGDGETTERAVFVFHGEEPFCAGGDEVDLAGGEVSDVGLGAAAEPVAFLGFLAVEDEGGGEDFAGFEGEVDFDGVGFGEGLAEFFGVAADLVVVDGEPAVEDDLIDPVEGGSAEVVFFGHRGEWGGGAVGGDAENDVVFRVDIGFETEFVACGVDAEVFEVEVAAVGHAVGEHFAAGETEYLHDPVEEWLLEIFAGAALDGELVVGEEAVILHEGRVREVDEDTDAAVQSRFEDGAEETFEGERGEFAFGRGEGEGLEGDAHD